MDPGEGRSRPRLKLAPRNEALAAKKEEERLHSARSNPFGAARPREAVLATRTGQKEGDILKAESEKDRLKLRLTGAEEEKLSTLQAEIRDLESGLASEEDPFRKEDLEREVSEKKSELDTLLVSFEKLALDKAKTGDFLRPSERRKLQEEREGNAQGLPPSFSPNLARGSFGREPDTAFNVVANSSSRQYGNGHGNGTANRQEDRPRSQRTGYDATPSSGSRYQPSSTPRSEAPIQNSERHHSRDMKAPLGSNDIFASNLSYPNIAPNSYVQDRF